MSGFTENQMKEFEYSRKREDEITRLQSENRLLREELEKEKGVVEFYKEIDTFDDGYKVFELYDDTLTRSPIGSRARQRIAERREV